MPIEIEDDVLTIDRTTLEQYGNCPAQAVLLEHGNGRIVGEIAVVGDEVHKAIGDTVGLYIESGGTMDRKALLEELETNLRSSRPDVQPQVVKAFQRSCWSFSDWLWRLSSANILRYDGGRGDRSGQLSVDFDMGTETVRVTSELDMLHSTASPELLQEIDWKTGWKPWTAESVQDSFQFQVHAFLVFENYPEIQGLRVAIWSRRINGLTWSTEFKRAYLKPIETRIRYAIGDWLRWRSAKDGAKAETRPTAEKCRICPVSHKCPVVDLEIPEMFGNPGKWLDKLAAVDAAGDAIRKRLGTLVDLTGRDVIGTGIGFGNEKPKTARKQKKATYKIGGAAQDDEDSHDES
jgi:hypothetical protein